MNTKPVNVTLNADARKLLEKKYRLLQEYMSKLEKYVSLETLAIVGNDDKILAMERCFQLVVDEAIDINAVLAYQLGNVIPDESRSSFKELAELDIIDRAFAEEIADSVKIRNQVTHDYDKLSKDDVVKFIKKYFEMYKIYAKILVERFIIKAS